MNKNGPISQQINPATGYVACDNCALDDVCRPVEIGGRILSLVHDLMGRREPAKAGDLLFRKGDPIKAIYAVTSGTIKMVHVTDTGLQQVLGFRFPGELFGEEAIFPRHYNLDAIAVDDATVCRIPIAELEDLGEKIPSVQRDLIDLISRQCYLLNQQMSSYLARNSAEERLSAFLVNVSERNASHTGSETELNLAMSRDDIANYLGFRRETLSRSLKGLQKLGMIRVSGKKVSILDRDKLRHLAQY
jgi:CRP/FNR family transcriptional regulator